jgi:hypothetical protein
MLKAILAIILLFMAVLTFGQQRKATKPKAKPQPTAAKLKWEPYTPCGVYYKDVIDFMDDFDKGWRFIGQTKTDQIWYDSDRERCTDNGILKAWIKEMHIGTDLKYALVLYELKCKTDELRVKSRTEYERDGHVLESDEYQNESWSDVIPDSIGDSIMKTVCRTPH